MQNTPTHRPHACTELLNGSRSGSPVELPPSGGARRPRGPETRRILPRPAQLNFSCLAIGKLSALRNHHVCPSTKAIRKSQRPSTHTHTCCELSLDWPNGSSEFPLFRINIFPKTGARHSRITQAFPSSETRPRQSRACASPRVANDIASTTSSHPTEPNPQNYRDTHYKHNLSLVHTRQGKQQQKI